ncbi:uncharacterized protein LOC135147754 [Daucus carota subsp. sativus]|uniref:uncharacterized protein LOC135147754 n=1 Tax=Daucus carota subsp. sativus TaxID=79200 RepID=UPI003083566F
MAMSTPKLKIYQDVDSLCLLPKKIASEIESLQEKEFGLLLAIKAADSYKSHGSGMFVWEKQDKFGERIITEFSSEVFKVLCGNIPSGTLLVQELSFSNFLRYIYSMSLVNCY